MGEWAAAGETVWKWLGDVEWRERTILPVGVEVWKGDEAVVVAGRRWRGRWVFVERAGIGLWQSASEGMVICRRFRS